MSSFGIQLLFLLLVKPNVCQVLVNGFCSYHSTVENFPTDKMFLKEWSREKNGSAEIAGICQTFGFKTRMKSSQITKQDIGLLDLFLWLIDSVTISISAAPVYREFKFTIKQRTLENQRCFVALEI
jgi:hypothetical protein